MRWSGQQVDNSETGTLPGLARVNDLVRTIRTPEFAGMTFYEVLAKSALNRVPGTRDDRFGWTINTMRGCQHACAYCFARPTHRYLDLDAGHDFDTSIVVKVNVVDVLKRELSAPNWERHPVALGTNTDPYQRAEGRYRLMPGVIAALADSRTPFSILTKGTLLRRDIPALVEASSRTAVDLAMSIAIYDDKMQQSVEPGTPTASARLATVKAVTDAGLKCSVFLMPILPYLTDTVAHLDTALARVRAAGATSVLYSTLYLKPGTREWFFEWLAREHPELVGSYERFYADSVYGPAEYRKWLTSRMLPLIRRHGLERAREDPVTGGPRSRALGYGAPPGSRSRSTGHGPRMPGAESASSLPMLF